MKWSKTKNTQKATVIASKIKDPDKTILDIQKETGLPKSTVADILDKDLGEVRKSSEIIAEIVANDLESVKEMSELTKIYMKQIHSSAIERGIDRADLQVANSTADSAFKRTQLLTGKSTENIEITDKRAIESLNQLL